MTTLLLWLFSGLFAWNITYHSFKRYWYLRSDEDYWKTKEGEKTLKGMRIALFLYLLGGFISLCSIVFALLLAGMRPVYHFDINEK